MEKIKKFRALMIAIFLISAVVNFAAHGQSYHATYYVSETGSDITGTGSQSNPWKTLAKTASVINSDGQGENYLVYVMSNLTSNACARYYDNSVTVSSFGTSTFTVTRNAVFDVQSELRRSWYNPAMLEIGSIDIAAGPIISLTLKNIIFDDAYLNPVPTLAVPASFRYAPISGSSSTDFVQDAIVASYSPRATIILGAGTELRNFGGMTAARVTDGATLIMETGSTIADIGSTTATRQVSSSTHDYRAKGEAAVVAGTASHFYMYEGATITDIANAHGVKIGGGGYQYKCFIDGEIKNMKGNRGMGATDGNQSSTHSGRGFKNAVLLDGGITLDPTTGLPGSAIIGSNANIHHNTVKSGTVAINRNVNTTLKIYGKVNNNTATTGSATISILTLAAGTNGGGLYVVAGGTIYLEEGCEIKDNSVYSGITMSGQSTSGYGGAASIQQGGARLVMNGGTVSGNRVGTAISGINADMAGLVLSKGDATFTLNGGIIDNGNHGVRLQDFGSDGTTGRLLLNNGTISGVTIAPEVVYGHNTRGHLWLDKENVQTGTGYTSVAGRNVYPISADYHIGNPNTATYTTIRAAMPTDWHLPTTNDNIIGFWMKKGGIAMFSVPKPNTGNANTDYLSSKNKFYVAVLETNAAGNANASTIKIYPTNIENGFVVVSVPLDAYPNGATVALIQPANDEELLITAPSILKHNPSATTYSIPYTVIHDIELLRPQMITDGHTPANTHIQLVIYPDEKTIPVISSIMVNSEIFEITGTPIWDAFIGELTVTLVLKPGWDSSINTETKFTLNCLLDANDFQKGDFLYLTGNLSITGGAGATQNYFHIFGNMVETEMAAACSENAIDIEGNEYTVTSLAGLCWTSNIKSTLYADGSTVPFAKPYYSDLYPDTVKHKSIFGLLYTWYSALNVCPAGWRLPTQTELSLLSDYPSEDLKSEQYWLIPGTNVTGFDARPAGKYCVAQDQFVDLYGFTGYWASDSKSNLYAHSLTLLYYCDHPIEIETVKTDGLSVRCVEDL